MTVDLRDQLHELCAFIDEEQGPISADNIRVRVDPVVAVGRPTRPIRPAFPGRRRWLVAVAAAALVVAASLPLLVFTGNDDSDRSLDSAQDVSAPESAELPWAASSDWSRVPDAGQVFGGQDDQWMNSVTSGGPGLVAVGSVVSENLSSWSPKAAVWTSVGGLSWSPVPLDEVLFGGSMQGVIAAGPGLVAVGTDEDRAAVWTSVDGLIWSRVPDDEAVFGPVTNIPYGGVGMNDVTTGGPGLVAVGSDNGRAAVWISVDGLAWSRVPDDGVAGGEGLGLMNGVTAGGPGLVAVGSDGIEVLQRMGTFSLNARAAVWTSVDGFTWTRVSHDEDVFGGQAGQSMSSVTAGGPGLVAVGSDESDAAIWTSIDGLTWLRVPGDGAVFGSRLGQGLGALSVTVGGPGLVAVGSHRPGDVDAAVWVQLTGD